MIFYYSGTGNSQLAALRLAEGIGVAKGDVVSVNPLIRSGEPGAFSSDEPLVFVSPTYCWRLPSVVARWLRAASFSGCREAYFVLTCGGSVGNAAPYVERLCRELGLDFRGLAAVRMPENYLALFPTPDEDECRAITERAMGELDHVAARIAAGETLSCAPANLLGKIESGPVHPLFERFMLRDAPFSASDACVSCGACARRCVMGNITIEGGRPVWHGRCTHCMACVGGCPTQAIEYGRASRGRHRHYVMDDRLCWG